MLLPIQKQQQQQQKLYRSIILSQLFNQSLLSILVYILHSHHISCTYSEKTKKTVSVATQSVMSQ